MIINILIKVATGLLNKMNGSRYKGFRKFYRIIGQVGLDVRFQSFGLYGL